MFFPTLFSVKINWLVYALGLVGVVMIIPDISAWRFFALAIAGHQFMLLFYAYGYVIPVRYWAGSLACLQYLVGPSFAYSGLDEFMYFKYRMQVPEEVYFSYAIPAVICFILGLHVSQKLNGEKVDEKSVNDFVESNTNMPYVFVGIGFLSGIVSGFFGSELANVFYILSGFKFIGLFMIILSKQPVKLWVLVLVVGAIISSSLKTAMFHDLLTWLVFVLAVLAIRYKPSIVVKVGFAIGMVIMVIIIQQIKSVYRSNITYGEGNTEAFEESFRTINQEGGFFDMNKIAESNVRINQGFIVTNAMAWVPEREPFAKGEELRMILEAAFLPRILAPDKLKAGDNSLVLKYTGLRIRQGTSMSISALGDGYVNFGTFGGSIFMFFFGLAFNIVLNGFQRFSRYFPIILIFTPLVFYYPIRPDTALQTGLGHMVKASFLLYVIMIFWKKDLSSAGVEQKIQYEKAKRAREERMRVSSP
ncbi:MAG: hypothetical protein LC100_12415 [Chitinophagales bacterium]|nr:hypothetical protein [Chitinophagales bacterium]